jgi:hypothetical protein
MKPPSIIILIPACLLIVALLAVIAVHPSRGAIDDRWLSEIPLGHLRNKGFSFGARQLSRALESKAHGHQGWTLASK